MTRLLRSLHTSARLASATATPYVPSAAAGAAIPAAWAEQGVRGFTPKGRPIALRPARESRVTLPSGYPEPPSYPPPAAYWAELDEIDATKGKPKPHPLWAFFHVPPQHTERPDGTAAPDNLGSVELLSEEEEGLKSGEYRVPASERSRRKLNSWWMWRQRKHALREGKLGVEASERKDCGR